MITAGLIWLLLIVAAAGGYIMFDGMVLLAAACFLVLLGAALILGLLWQKRGIQAGFEKDICLVQQKEEVQAKLILHNQKPFPATRIRVRLEIQEPETGGQRIRKETVLSLRGKAEAAVYCRVSSRHCQIQQVRVRELRLYDALQIFSVGLPVPNPERIGILPERFPVSVQVKEDGEACEEEEVRMLPGNDPFIVRQIREYQPGDAMRQIDWKQSARLDRWMVREYGEAKKEKQRIVLWLNAGADLKKADPKRKDGWFAAAVSLAGALAGAGASVSAVWQEKEKEIRMPGNTEQERTELAFALIGAEFSERGESVAHMETGEKLLCLDSFGRLWDGSRCLAEFPEQTDEKEKSEPVRIVL